jgi:hypothetical protein
MNKMRPQLAANGPGPPSFRSIPTTVANRRAKFYRLTAKGRRHLLVETNKWDRLAGAIARILRPAGEEGPS